MKQNEYLTRPWQPFFWSQGSDWITPSTRALLTCQHQHPRQSLMLREDTRGSSTSASCLLQPWRTSGAR